MNERMEREMERTITLLQASVPQRTRPGSRYAVLRIAASEISALHLLALLAGVLVLGMAGVKLANTPMLAAFCTAPVPMLLLFHRYVLHCSPEMRELESTFPYTYEEMLLGRAAVISGWSLGMVVALALVLRAASGESFLRLALCGGVPSVYLSALLLALSGRLRNPEGISVTAIACWVALCFIFLLLPARKLLELCSTGCYGAALAVGLLLYGACIRRNIRRGDLNAAGIG